MILTRSRAGANFSALSASDKNALRWDKLGYKYLLNLAAKDGKQAFVQETSSKEYWDEMPSRTKLDSMASYLKNVSRLPTVGHLPSPLWVTHMEYYSTKKFPGGNYRKVLHLVSRLRQ